MRSTMVLPPGEVWSKKREPTMFSEWRSAARRSFGFSLSLGSPWLARSRLCRQRIASRTSSRLARVGLRSVLAQPWLALALGGVAGRACEAAGAISAASASTVARPGPLRRTVVRNTIGLPARQVDSDRFDGPEAP